MLTSSHPSQHQDRLRFDNFEHVFHGLAGKDPHKHLKEFHVMCSIMRPHRILEDYIKMKAYPFSLDGAAKD
ncbi:hypothetical protein CR513_06987, partial [Mucuna pruriens]